MYFCKKKAFIIARVSRFLLELYLDNGAINRYGHADLAYFDQLVVVADVDPVRWHADDADFSRLAVPGMLIGFF